MSQVAQGGHPQSESGESSQGSAVLVIHGISPQSRYGIQDEFSAELAQHLNGRQNALGLRTQKPATRIWKTAVIFPAIGQQDAAISAIRPTLVRGHQSEVDPEDPKSRFIDVYEAYWSPIDKGRTTPLVVLSWLLKGLFIPVNTTTRLYAGFGKTVFDLAYVAVALVIAIAAACGIAYGAIRSYGAVVTFAAKPDAANVGFWGVLLHPLQMFTALGLRVGLALAVIAVGFYVLLQGSLALFNTFRQSYELAGQASQVRFRRGLATALIVGGALAIVYARPFPLGQAPGDFVWPAIWLVVGVFSLRVFLAVGSDFLVNRLGDVQIYTTHDENSKFFELRSRIVDLASQILVDIIRKGCTADGRSYGRVFVAGHSLGSTIAMDALIRVHSLVEEDGLDKDEWRRVRALLTFGTSLEKTKYFFDCQQPTMSGSYLEWRDDLYGHLFTTEFGDLRGQNTGNRAIYWANYWYFHDLVANEIKSYCSKMRRTQRLSEEEQTPLTVEQYYANHAGKTLVCQNARLESRFPFRPWGHSDYLSDSAFWYGGTDLDKHAYHGALEVLLS